MSLAEYFKEMQRARNEHLRAIERRIANQRRQLGELEWKMGAMKTWYGIFRTIGQKFGVCR